MQDMLLPKMVERVNQAPEFQDLRTVYLSRVAAQWVRDRDVHKPTVYSDIIDSGNIERWTVREPWDPMEVFGRYLKSFNEKEFRVEEKTVIDGGRAIQTTIRTYGGVNFTAVPKVDVGAATFADKWPHLPATVNKSLDAITLDVDGPRLWLGGAVEPLAQDLTGPAPRLNDDAGRKDEGTSGTSVLPQFFIVVLIVIGWSLVIRRSVRSRSAT